jgi:hypothetical protein
MDRFIGIAGVALFTFTLGCGGSEKAGSRDGAAGGFTSSAILTGDPIGLDLDLPSKLTRQVPATVTGSDMTGDVAYLGRFSATSDSGTMMVPVTNQGSRWLCFIEATTYEILDASGTSLGTPVVTYLRGSVGRGSTSGTHTNTCLEPGGTGYFLGTISGAAFTSLASVRMVLTSGNNDYLPPQTSVVPVSYTTNGRDMPYTITIVNQGPMTATSIDGYAVYFDASNVPANWGHIQVVRPSDSSDVHVDLAPGATATMVSDSLLATWTGNSTRQLVMIDFEVY